MPKNIAFLLVLITLLVSSCSSGAAPVTTPEVVSVYSSSSAEPWLSALYDCAQASSVLSRVDDPANADIVLRVGEPEVLTSFAYQIDTEEILIVTHRQSPVQNLTMDDARALFTGQGDLSVQVWVYASGEDIQQVFDKIVMDGRAVTSSAMVAANSQQMSDAINSQANAVGFLSRHWKMGDSRFVYSIPDVPVLAITPTEPQGAVRNLIACLQQ